MLVKLLLGEKLCGAEAAAQIEVLAPVGFLSVFPLHVLLGCCQILG
jgi:hypothetical protein